MFTEIMPLYQRQAILITHRGAFECEMEKMYLYFSNIIIGKEELPQNKRRDSKFIHTIKEFRKLKIPREPTEDFNLAITTLNDEVREIRNIWAHNGGKDTRDKIDKNLDGIEEKYSQISISKEYIEKVIGLMRTVSLELNKSARPIAMAANKRMQMDKPKATR